MERQLLVQKGEGRHRLEEGQGHSERLFLQQVWYPAIRSFDHLFGEYEVADFKDGSRYLDFAYIREPIKLAIEIDGYGPHSAKVSRWQFSDSLMRQNHLIIDGWQLLRFSYDDIAERPRMCEQILQQFMGCWLGGVYHRGRPRGASELLEAEVLRYGLRLNRPLRPRDVMELLQISREKAYHLLHQMLLNNLLRPAGKGTKTIRSFLINREQLGDRR
ncbi:DNA-binding response regulator [Paenibacillus sp. DLE-14]|uniref:DNA-binding response regulator n=2 Tax=Paenibacillus lignilyticus TaxID=1172615 RepID=A0ABS5C8Z8_9BACL|nr:DNA-binding response regulator [Paenibacillus lignilyticus]